MAGATCLFIGAVPLARDQRRMAISLQNDFEQMIAFASEGSTRQRGQVVLSIGWVSLYTGILRNS